VQHEPRCSTTLSVESDLRIDDLREEIALTLREDLDRGLAL
jgi:hypothetical protein